MTLAISSMALAAQPVSNDQVDKNISFSDDTIITEDNIYDVLKYFGLDESALIFDEDCPKNEVTVEELREAIEKSQKLPQKVTLNRVASPKNTVVVDKLDLSWQTEEASKAAASTGTKTLHDYFTVGGCELEHRVSGKYYKNGSTKYWTEERSSSMYAHTDEILHKYEIKNVTGNTLIVVNAGTISSYLKHFYNYDLVHYLSAGIAWIEIGRNSIDGWTKYYGSDYL